MSMRFKLGGVLVLLAATLALPAAAGGRDHDRGRGHGWEHNRHHGWDHRRGHGPVVVYERPRPPVVVVREPPPVYYYDPYAYRPAPVYVAPRPRYYSAPRSGLNIQLGIPLD
ncbi:hypothetical protein ACFSM5_11940 [Lacibacterium aquatile]|uniref:Uncharacterized protein n=1 Tax=Lacibacterium aquatile TaxID=1168082 RepID=A0ABW5DVW7_9PROT